MLVMNDRSSARVQILPDWSVSKRFRGANASERFENEIRVLRFLESKLCNFVPRLIQTDRSLLEIRTTHCGTAIEHLSPRKLAEIFKSLEAYGVRHDEPLTRNLMYKASDGSFYVIDFEHASIIDKTNGPDRFFYRIDKQLDDLDQALNADNLM